MLSLDFSKLSLEEIVGKESDMFKDAASDLYPSKLPLFVLKKSCYVPGMTVPLIINEGMYYNMLKTMSLLDNKFIGLVLTRDQDQDINKVDKNSLFDIGVLAKVLRIVILEEGISVQMLVSIESRIQVKDVIKGNNCIVVKVDYHKEVIPENKKNQITAYTSSLVKTIKDILLLNPMFKEELTVILNHSDFAQPWKICDFSVIITTSSREEKQKILSTLDLLKRLEFALILLKKELDITNMQIDINKKIETAVAKPQKAYILKEQLKAIQKELDIYKDNKTSDVDKFEKMAEKISFSEEASVVFKEEMEKLKSTDIHSAEYAVIRGYLDILTSLPWGVKDQTKVSLKESEKILKEDHYGLEDVKNRILEYISVGIMTKGAKGYMICLVGPPGVGKTSIGKSIARSLQRKFFRFSLGGIRDDAEIKGHRRTYIGAMPGKIIQALKTTGVNNPVIMLDEIDKMGISLQGDPASALLEVLDPEQNKDFLDYYLDVRFDLSNILFITTANNLDPITSPLRDRMEIISLPGYIEEEKLKIASDYLIPKNAKEVGLTEKDFVFRPLALKKIIKSYCREAGVRGLEKMLNKILRKITLEKVRSQEKKKSSFVKKVIDVELVEKYLGKSLFNMERFYGKEMVPGVVTGLAWTELGGSILYIEAVKHKGKERLCLTGNTGDIMKESAHIALTYLHSRRSDYLSPEVNFFQEEFHIHIPEGATPKDGPSAGITLTTALISLLKKKPVPIGFAMTGEITITGKILPVGGLREKFVAARRENVKKVIAPSENIKDYEELPDSLKKGIKTSFVKDYKEVYEILFGPRK